MQFTEYFETLTDPFFAILDLALERPLPSVSFLVAVAAAAVFLAIA